MHRLVLTLCLAAVSTLSTGRGMDDLFPRATSFIPVAQPNYFLPVLHAFHAYTQDLNPLNPLYSGSEGDAKAALIALRAKPTPWGVGGQCNYSGISIADASGWTLQTATFRKDLFLNSTYICSDSRYTLTGFAHQPAALGSPMGCADIGDELRSLPAGSKFTTPYAPMACVHRQTIDRPPCCEDGYGTGPLAAGNPINFGNGRKVQIETDYRAPGPSRLMFQRYHSEHTVMPYLPSPIGYNWNHSFNRALFDGGNPAPGIYSVGISEPNGHWTWFRSTGTNTYVSMYNPGDRLTKVGTTWQRRKSNDDLEVYDAPGKNTRLQSLTGRGVDLIYDAQDRLACVEDDDGRRLCFTYGSHGQVSQITLPDGGALTYDYSTDGKKRLTAVHYPGGTTRAYGADAAARLTTITDENGVVYLNIAYNGYNKATSTSGPGNVNKYAYTTASAYGGPWLYGNEGTAGPAFDLVTPLGDIIHFTTVNVNGTVRPATVSAPCPECGIGDGAAFTFNPTGRLLSSTDFDDRKTCYAYDTARNLQTARVDGLLATDSCSTALVTLPARAGVRKVSTQWHAAWRLPIKRAEPHRLTTYAYNGDGGSYCAPINVKGVLCKQVEYATADATGQQGLQAAPMGTPAVSLYTYNGAGQVLTATEPDGKRTTTTYHLNGDTYTVTDPTGKTITIPLYDGAGRPRTMIDYRGPMTLTYWPRGWPRTITSVDGTSSFDYYKTGEMLKTQRPDGAYLLYTRDAARRLTQVKDELGNKIVYTLDLASNVTKVQRFNPSGVLVASWSPDAESSAASAMRTTSAQMRPQFHKDGAFRFHGMWCGPGWTGGNWNEYGHLGSGEQYLPAQDALDKCCTTHDICYYECRCEFGCDPAPRYLCHEKCDRELANCAEAAGYNNPLFMVWFRHWGPMEEANQPGCFKKFLPGSGAPVGVWSR